MNTKVMFSLPDKLVSRMRATIPAQQRSKIAAILFEKEIIEREKKLYLCAKELEENKSLTEEMLAIEQDFIGDGLDNV